MQQRSIQFTSSFLYFVALAWICDGASNSVVVERGYGSRTYQVGQLAHVWAEAPPPGQMFRVWGGGDEVLINRWSRHTGVVVRNGAHHAVSALYRAAPVYTTTAASYKDVNYNYVIPSGTRFAVIYFHDKGGSGADLFQRNTGRNLVNELLAVVVTNNQNTSFAVIAVDSADRQAKTWDLQTPVATNVDVQNALGIMSALRSKFSNDPLYFLIGEGNGGEFAAYAAPALKARAQALFGAGGYKGIAAGGTRIPTIFLLGQNDGAAGAAGGVPGLGPQVINDARSSYQALQASSVPSELWVNAPSPLYPERFARIKGLTTDDSKAIYDALTAAGLVGADGLILTDPYFPEVQAAIPAQYSAHARDIQEELVNCYGEHGLFDEYDMRLFDVFLKSAGLMTPVTTPNLPTGPVLSSATYSGYKVAQNSIAAAFGTNLASSTAKTPTVDPPTVLAGTSALYHLQGVSDTPLPLFFVSPSQVNFLLPQTASPGWGSLKISNAASVALNTDLKVGAVAPGLYSANGNGYGPPAANLQRVRGDGSSSIESIVTYDSTAKVYVPAPIDLGPATDSLYLILYGTGIRNAQKVLIQMGGRTSKPAYAGPQGAFTGLDQINVRLPRSLSGSGIIDLMVLADGEPSNSLVLNIR